MLLDCARLLDGDEAAVPFGLAGYEAWGMLCWSGLEMELPLQREGSKRDAATCCAFCYREGGAFFCV